MKTISFLFLAAFMLFAGCKKQTVDKIECDTSAFSVSTTTYSGAVVPILQTQCYTCHSNSNQQGGINLQGYTNLKVYVDNDQLLGTIAHLRGYDAMPKNANKLAQEDICKIKFWIDNGALNN